MSSRIDLLPIEFRLDFKFDDGFMEAGIENGFVQIHGGNGGSNFSLNVFHNGESIDFEKKYLTIYDALNAANEWYQDAAYDWYIQASGDGPSFYYLPTPEAMNSWVAIDKATKMTRKQAKSELDCLLNTVGRGSYWITFRRKEQ